MPFLLRLLLPVAIPSDLRFLVSTAGTFERCAIISSALRGLWRLLKSAWTSPAPLMSEMKSSSAGLSVRTPLQTCQLKGSQNTYCWLVPLDDLLANIFNAFLQLGNVDVLAPCFLTLTGRLLVGCRSRLGLFCYGSHGCREQNVVGRKSRSDARNFSDRPNLVRSFSARLRQEVWKAWPRLASAKPFPALARALCGDTSRVAARASPQSIS